MTNLDLKFQIERSIMAFSQGNLRENGIRLLKSLGYGSDRQVSVEPNTFAGFLEIHPPLENINKKKALLENWLSVDILLQLTGEDLKQMTQGHFIFDKSRIDNQIIESYLFLAIELKPEDYSRTKLADVTREVNRFFAMPVMILFKYGDALTLSIINRRLHKIDESKDVLEKVTLIKGINTKTPIRAHIEILFDLSLPELEKASQMHSFVELHRAWQKTLDISELNKRFYREIANWYFYAVEHVEFPKGTTEDRQSRNATNIIRLITRLIFVWFIKEKRLVPEALFNPNQLKEILNFNDPHKSTYYKAILQNLFFATLNTEMGSDRRFRGKNRNPNGLDAHHGISTVYRYEDFFKDPAQGLTIFAGIPFLNGGLFECLDKREEKILVDGFSDDPRNQPVVPDSLFFGDELTVDMSEIYGDKHHSKEKVRGLIRIFDSYKFTIEENTPLDEEIALDPELLGKVFENLLAAFNPETGTTARKQTGSFYTPREIVNYMVDESLIAYLQNSLHPDEFEDNEKSVLETKLRHLLAYNNEPHQFSQSDEDQIISAIDKVKVLDPACGSGAFPMGVLHKLVFILNKLDPGNVKWKERQIAKASEIPDSTVRDQVIDDIEKSFTDNELDYGRKLYLIENCIYGVDIQPIAVQIAKLRFFISLVVDQNINRTKPNLGIRPLPNLESKFVAANTLVGIEKPQQMLLHNPQIDEKEKQLAEVRDSLFTARTPATKRNYRELDRRLREEIAELLINDGWNNATAIQLANWDPYDQNVSAEFFDSEWMFGVMEGFDVVIGNPPYSLVGSNKPNEQKYFRKEYKLTAYKINTYLLFIEKGFTLLKNKNALLAFIIPKSLVFNTFFEKTREQLLTEYTIQQIVEIQEKVFESAEVGDNILLFAGRDKEPLKNELKYYKVSAFSPEFTFVEKYEAFQYYLLKLPGKRFVRSKFEIGEIRVPYKQLCEFVSITNGLNPGNVRHILLTDKKETDHHQKMLLGKDIQRYYLDWSGTWVNFDKNLKNQISLVDTKSKKGMTAQQKVDFALRNPEIYLPNKILVRKTADHIIASYDPYGFYYDSLAYGIQLNKEVQMSIFYFLGILNSKYINFFHNGLSQNENKVFAKVLSVNLSKLPIRIIDFSNYREKAIHDQIVDTVIEINKQKSKNPMQTTTSLENTINNLVYELFGLTEKETAIVDGKPSDLKRKNPAIKEMPVEIIDDGTDTIEVLDIPIQSDYDLYKCSLCGKLVFGHDRENHAKEYHHGQSDWNILKK